MRFFRPQRFVIIFVARSGSTLLQTLLDSHPRVEATGEPFAPSFRPDAESQISWAELYWRTVGGRGPGRAVGFKTKWSDIADRERFAKLIRRRKARIITMYRQNAVKSAISLLTGQARFEVTGDWNRRAGESPLSPVLVDPEVFQNSLRFIEQHRRQMDRFANEVDVPTLSVEYEDLLLRRQAVLKDTCEFLGVRYRKLSTSLEKNTSDDLRKAIANFDSLRARYVGTHYEAMFDEVL